MARLGRRERLEKRKRLEALAALSLVRKEEARKDCDRLRSLPKRERNLLLGNTPDYMGISKDGLLGRTHYAGCSAARGMSGQGSKGLVAKVKAQSRRGQGPRFAPAFMAVKGKDDLDLSTSELVDTSCEILIPPAKKFVKL